MAKLWILQYPKPCEYCSAPNHGWIVNIALPQTMAELWILQGPKPCEYCSAPNHGWTVNIALPQTMAELWILQGPKPWEYFRAPNLGWLKYCNVPNQDWIKYCSAPKHGCTEYYSISNNLNICPSSSMSSFKAQLKIHLFRAKFPKHLHTCQYAFVWGKLIVCCRQRMEDNWKRIKKKKSFSLWKFLYICIAHVHCIDSYDCFFP